MAVSKNKIVVFKEGYDSVNLAEDVVGKALSIKSGDIIQDGVSMMATDFEPSKNQIVCNQELNFATATMTDEQAESLKKKEGVLAVEEDEIVYAFNDFPEDALNDFDEQFFEEDLESKEEILSAFSDLDEYSATQIKEMAPSAEDAKYASEKLQNFDEIDFDEDGNLIRLNESQIQDAGCSGIPRDKLLPLIKCILKCAQEKFEGKVTSVSEESISQILKEQDVEASASAARALRDYITCGLRIIYVPQAWRYSVGRGVRVAVVDTGIAPRHPDLSVYGGASFVPGVTSWHDDHYHGTHVAGTIAASMNNRGLVGVAPQARLYAVKVLNSQGRGSTSSILNGLGWCLRRRMHIVNLSLGSLANTHNPRNYSRAYEAAGQRLRRRGILPVAAAGNSGRSGSPGYPYVGNPARCPSFMAVSSIDCQRRRSSFSSFGPQVEITAPGTSVWSTFPPNGYRQLSGTSMACPHIAGVAALVKQRHPTWSGDRIRVHLWRTALDLGAPGRDWFYGFGQVNAYRAVR